MSGLISEMAKRGHIWSVRDKANLKRTWIFENIQNTKDKESQDNDLEEMFLGGTEKSLWKREVVWILYDSVHIPLIFMKPFFHPFHKMNTPFVIVVKYKLNVRLLS